MWNNLKVLVVSTFSNLCIYSTADGNCRLACLFIICHWGNDLVLYVDDLLIAGDNEGTITGIKSHLRERFDLKDLDIARKFLGMEIEDNDESINHQNHHYISSSRYMQTRLFPQSH